MRRERNLPKRSRWATMPFISRLVRIHREVPTSEHPHLWQAFLAEPQRNHSRDCRVNEMVLHENAVRPKKECNRVFFEHPTHPKGITERNRKNRTEGLIAARLCPGSVRETTAANRVPCLQSTWSSSAFRTDLAEDWEHICFRGDRGRTA